MNTSSLKSFAPAVRRQLIEAVGRKLDYVLTADTPDLRQVSSQVAALRKEAERDRAALVDRVAYTWFNRFAALRFLDAQGWHPFKARVLTPATPEETQPELLKLLRTGSLPAELNPHTDLQRLNDLLDGRLPTAIAGADPQGEAYRGLILASCRLYHTLLPDVFDKLNDESELLLPDDLLTATSVAEGFRTEITDADCLETDASGKSRANVETLGWLYQFYISEKKDAVMARKSAVPTEDIPAVTQLFTPHWIVRYLVENSLGRLWLLNRPGSRLREHMPYYIEGEGETDFLKITKPEEIRLCDPAVGSGHMLTYAFDLLSLIYEEEGYAPSEIPGLILRHNLHGLEICPRAAQLAQFALVCKAREKSRRFFQPEHLVQPHIIELRDVRFDEGELAAYFNAIEPATSSNPQSAIRNPQFVKLLHQFEEAKNYGSLIQPCLDERAIADVRRAIEAKDLGGQLFLRETHLKILRVLAQAEALTPRYHVVVANPPYMGFRQMNPALKSFVEEHFPVGKFDLCTSFFLRLKAILSVGGSIGMITPPNWMFISSFEEFRTNLLADFGIDTLTENGRGVWGPDFGSVAFVGRKERNKNRAGLFRRLFKRQGQVQSHDQIEANFRNTEEYPYFRCSTQELIRIPGSPIAYWISEKMRRSFEVGTPIGNISQPRQGMASSDNERFLKLWHEVSERRTCRTARNRAEALASHARWFPYNKGGAFRKWFGNNDWVVNWEDDGREVLAFAASLYGSPTRTIKNISQFFRESITWSALSISGISLRYNDPGFIFDTKGQCIFSDDPDLLFRLMALMNSSLAAEFMRIMAPTLDFNSGTIAKTPYIESPSISSIREIAKSCAALARADWDNFETSWDFRDQPLMRPGLKGATLEASWRNWEAQSTAAIRRMQELETENNRLFIAAYGLDGELQPEVPDEQITLARAETRRDIAAFLSYAVGCMMGRYSPDRPGLILANAGDTVENFRLRIADCGLRMEDLSFAPDEDGIVPVLDGEWFEDDIVARTRDFLRATFGEATLSENLRFIEDSLGKPLDKYFLTDFYKDHLQTYKKRPIYWLFQSPKKGFSALVYLHRYTRDTCNTLLNKYLRDYLHKLEARIAHLVQVEATSNAPKDKTAARKEREKLEKALKDCREWEREVILPLAQKRLEIDLDDGVKVNYQKFEGAVAPIPGLAAKEE